ncbi:hypothetical protein [Klebsiella variicola]|uniref:hypothetical protein n=1 Tax=Klebsiella variicola TaxID=244366 RepID=UPI000C7BE791|nr:hypothetical protein [Klebsiella variicola]ELI6991612.1 hypothetical protein [Klebsiella pneumoniae]PLK32913.1 hypothetical protein CYD38_19495 [Klebsiella variicola]REI46762.1 hypothetical protein DY002_22435 [Klebsiella variicola]REI49113.1 hypothetical protein DYB09_16225 [Klebsiella variicola]REI56863.1 hypothetical protein DYB19_08330 [Klebsiella variicola]
MSEGKSTGIQLSEGSVVDRKDHVLLAITAIEAVTEKAGESGKNLSGEDLSKVMELAAYLS